MLFFHCSRALVGQGLFVIEASRSHSDTPQSVGLLWASDRPVAEISTLQHATLTTDVHDPSWIRTHNFSRREAANARLRPGGHRDLHTILLWMNQCFTLISTSNTQRIISTWAPFLFPGDTHTTLSLTPNYTDVTHFYLKIIYYLRTKSVDRCE
jgi:hypothetical protein